jgi:hypothetical protein
MAKRIFFNTDIYKSDKDFVVGGFISENESVEWKDILAGVRMRLTFAVNQYIRKEMKALSKDDKTYEQVRKEAIDSLCRTINTYLEVKIDGEEAVDVMEQLYESKPVQDWLFGVKLNYDDFKSKNKIIIGVPVSFNSYNLDGERARKETMEFTIEEILESLITNYNVD